MCVGPFAGAWVASWWEGCTSEETGPPFAVALSFPQLLSWVRTSSLPSCLHLDFGSLDLVQVSSLQSQSVHMCSDPAHNFSADVHYLWLL